MVGTTNICRLVAPKGSTTLTLYLSFSADFTKVELSLNLKLLCFVKRDLPAGRLFKCLPILARNEVVDDRIDGRVQIKEYSSYVHQLLVCCKVNFLRNPLESKMKMN